MKTLKKFAFPEGRTVGDTTYNWEKFLDGAIYQLEEGTDYKCKSATFQTLARNAAKKRGKKIKFAKPAEGQPAGIVIQAYPDPNAGAAAAAETEGEGTAAE